MSENTIQAKVEKQREFFSSGQSKDISFWKKALFHLKKAIIKYEHEIISALEKDLKKPRLESYGGELG